RAPATGGWPLSRRRDFPSASGRTTSTCACRLTSAFALELAVDGVLELLVGDGAVQEDAVDEECGRPVHARLLSVLLVGVHLRRLLAAVEALVELALIETEVLGEGL